MTSVQKVRAWQKVAAATRSVDFGETPTGMKTVSVGQMLGVTFSRQEVGVTMEEAAANVVAWLTDIGEDIPNE